MKYITKNNTTFWIPLVLENVKKYWLSQNNNFHIHLSYSLVNEPAFLFSFETSIADYINFPVLFVVSENIGSLYFAHQNLNLMELKAV